MEKQKTWKSEEINYKTEREAMDASFLRLDMALSFDISKMKELLYSYREKLTCGGKMTNKKSFTSEKQRQKLFAERRFFSRLLAVVSDIALGVPTQKNS